MKRMSLCRLAIAAAACFSLSVGQANAESPSPIELASYGASCDSGACSSQGACSCDTNCGTLLCDANPCKGGGLLFQAETLFMKYTRADGNRVGNGAGEDVDWDYDITPRITLGYVTDSGLGFRTRFWEFDHSQATINGGGEQLSVDTYNIDLELFERFSITRCWDVELSGGMRYNYFEEHMQDPLENRFNRFHGWGGILGIEATRQLGARSGMYGRVRQAILVDDKFVQNQGFDSPGQTGVPESALLRDATVGMTELAMGWEYRRPFAGNSMLTFRSGYEWQNWQNFSSSFAGPTDPGFDGEEVFSGPADVGFHGFTASLAFDY